MRNQQGVVLIVSLVILLVVTLLGTVAMQGTGLEFKMANNSSERQRVFQATEAALRFAEKELVDRAYSAAELQAACPSGTATCFDDRCAGGLCFFGTFTSSAQSSCRPMAGVPSGTPVWFDTSANLNVWQTAGKYFNYKVDNLDIKYIVEFRCFVDAGPIATVLSDSGDTFFRITALGESSSGRLQVMLQSTYGVPK